MNLAARQSIYAYQQPRIDLARETLDLARLDGLNGADHLRELRGLIAEGPADLNQPPVQPRERIGLDQGELLLRSQFTTVTRHDFEGRLRVPDTKPIAAYVRSRVPDAGPLAAAVLGRLPTDPARFPITTHSGCLVCT